jgi:hypothetical protein
VFAEDNGNLRMPRVGHRDFQDSLPLRIARRQGTSERRKQRIFWRRVVIILGIGPNQLRLYAMRSGATIQFSGVPISFSKVPFNLAFEVEGAQPPVASLGAMASDWYLGPDKRDGENRAEFDLPAGWSVQGTRPSTLGGDVAGLTNPRFENATAAVWTEPHRIPASEVPIRLQKLITEAVARRPGLARYTIRVDSFRTTWISPRQAVQAIADYQSSTGPAMSEGDRR